MSTLEENLHRSATVINTLGLHARPAAMIANLASKAQSDIWLCKNGEQVDASSIIDILSLACVKGADVILKIEGLDTPVDRDVLEKIKAPLNHLLRNAVDHGVEDMEVRATRNKPQQATIILSAKQRKT